MENRNILIVDDQKNVAIILATSLSRFENYIIDMVHNGRDALEKCREQFFDLVVADYQLPDMNGVQVAKALQEISPKTKIILITALRANMIADSIEQDNIHFFLEKPFPLKQFVEATKEAINSVI